MNMNYLLTNALERATHGTGVNLMTSHSGKWKMSKISGDCLVLLSKEQLEYDKHDVDSDQRYS
eukprot:CAMPEP_0196659354 /NCGR_PEP_ID=MMETSP1086-20130531/34509_1 /TAXON_ID=77921 /ORGANISM="Cyanoptyche  gloeocystis , Strain SAG4.97" /LENGTH=62 /DNA_ID=CAMNT_0041993301 /DNA_START=275 /DNA_END=463 /DNA_ORIENTATION=-